MHNGVADAPQRRAYPAYKPLDVVWLGDVPEPWEVRRLKYTSTINDEALPETTDPDYEFAYVDIGSVDAARGITTTETYRFEAAPSRARRIVRDGDTIVSTVRTYLRAIAPIRAPQEDLIVSTGFAVIRPRTLHPGYLSYALRSPFFVETVVSRSTGVSYPAINASEIGAIGLPVPTLPEQRAIAAFLDRETARIDGLIAKKQRQIELLQEKRAALISHAVTKGLDPDAPMKDSGIEWLGQIPEHWDTRPLKLLFANLDYRRIPLSAEERSYMEKKYPYYGASGIIDAVDDYIFDEPLILVAEDGANLLSRSTPLAFIAEGEYWVNNHAHILKPLFGPLKYWEGVLQTFDYTPLISGAAQPKLTAEDLNALPLPFPPVSEQQAIACLLDKETKTIDMTAAKVERSVAMLREYRTALISAAVTGKIDVREEGNLTPSRQAAKETFS